MNLSIIICTTICLSLASCSKSTDLTTPAKIEDSTTLITPPEPESPTSIERAINHPVYSEQSLYERNARRGRGNSLPHIEIISVLEKDEEYEIMHEIFNKITAFNTGIVNLNTDPNSRNKFDFRVISEFIQLSAEKEELTGHLDVPFLKLTEAPDTVLYSGSGHPTPECFWIAFIAKAEALHPLADDLLLPLRGDGGYSNYVQVNACITYNNSTLNLKAYEIGFVTSAYEHVSSYGRYRYMKQDFDISID